jgi:hypothetical protein
MEIKSMGYAMRKQVGTTEVIRPGSAFLLGVAFGCTLAILCALVPPRDFSLNFLLILLLSLGPCGGFFGYGFWILADPRRRKRFYRITGFVAATAILGLGNAFPSFWRHVEQSMGPHVVVTFMGGAFAAAMMFVTAGWGMVHLIGGFISLFSQPDRRAANSLPDGVWDIDLDNGWWKPS